MMESILNYLASNWYLIVGGLILGFSVGTLTGLFGAGGGFIITPALNVLLGVDYNMAVGTSACQVLGASSFSLYHQLDRKLYGSRIALLMGIGVPVGAYLGTTVVGHIKNLGTFELMGRQVDIMEFSFMSIFAVFLILIAGWLILDNFYLRRHRDDEDDDHTGYLAWIKIPPMVKFRTVASGPFSVPVLVCMGLSMGFLGGIFGIGGGVIMMPMLFYLVGQETKYATVTSMMLIFVSGLSTSVSCATKGWIKYDLVAALIVGAFFGARLGAFIHKKVSGKSLRKYFAFVVLGAVLMVLFKVYLLVYGAHEPKDTDIAPAPRAVEQSVEKPEKVEQGK